MAYQLSHYKDIDDSVASIIYQYYQFLNANDYKNAALVLKENAEALKPYRIDANGLNKIEQGIMDLWQIASSSQTVVITEDQTEPIGNYPLMTEWYAEF